MNHNGTPRKRPSSKKPTTGKRAKSKPSAKSLNGKTIPGTDAPAAKPVVSNGSGWTTIEEGMLPILLALMTRTLPSVLAKFDSFSLSDSDSIQRVISAADEALLNQMQDFSHIPPEKRERYWHGLLAAILEDDAVDTHRN